MPRPDRGPDLAEGIDPRYRARAQSTCVARTIRMPRGRWNVPGPDGLRDGIGLLVLEGLLLRRVGIDGRFGAELLGVGDLLRPWQGDDARTTLALTTGWKVLEPVPLAMLDERRPPLLPTIHSSPGASSVAPSSARATSPSTWRSSIRRASTSACHMLLLASRRSLGPGAL